MFSTLINSFLPRPRAATVQTLGHPRAGIIGWYGGDDNSSGEVVTEESALKFAAFWCGLRIISETLASLPCIMYQREFNGDKTRATNDERYRLVHDAPNDELDAYHFFEVGTAHIVTWGNCYDRIMRNGFNDPVSLELRLPDRTEPKRRRDDGVLTYECSDPRETVEFQDMLHVAGFSFDGIKGYSLIKMAAQSLGIAVAADKYAGASLKNGAVPSGVLEIPTRLGKPAREELRREWDEIHGSASKSGRLAIVHGGSKYHTISMNHEDAQLLQSRKFSIPEIARWLRLPPHMLADLENSQVRANIEQQAMEFIQYSLTPWVKRWEGALRMKLLRREEKGTYFFEFLFDSLLRGDTLARYQAHALARQWGFRNVNEIKSIENENGIGPDGETYLEPLNMIPLGTPREQPEAKLPSSIVNDYQMTLTNTIRETVDIAKQMKGALAQGVFDVNTAFSEYGGLLHQTLSAERDTFKYIKQDIAELGQTVSVSVPEMAPSIVCSTWTPPEGWASYQFDTTPPLGGINELAKTMLAESLRVLFKIEGGEAVKAARAQMRDASQNFIKRIEKFYVGHESRVAQALQPYTQNDDDTQQHIEQSKLELIECCDGEPAGFEQRVKECVERWESERSQQQAEEFHARLHATNGGS